MPAKSSTFRAFNGLRLFAALGVVFYHYAQEVPGFQTLPLPLRNLVNAGPLALLFFFLLSGFVLAFAYARRLPATPAQRRSFWYARFARLYPVYLVAFVLFLPSAVGKYLLHPVPGRNAATFVTGIALTLPALQSWTPFSQAWNGPAWSLSVEAFFYFLFPFVIRPVLRMRWAALVAALLPLWATMLALTWAHNTGRISTDFWRAWIEYHPLFWSPIFLIGIATYRLYAERSTSPTGSPARASLLAFLAGGALLLLCAVLSPPSRELLLYGGGVPLLMLLILALAHPTSMASRSLGTRALFTAGAASYVTYIVQAPVWHLYVYGTDRLMHHLQGTVDPWQFWSYVPLLIVLSLLIHVWIEEPAQRWLLARRPAPVLADPAIEAA